MKQDIVDVTMQDLNMLLRFVDCPDLADAVCEILPGWQLKTDHRATEKTPDIVFERIDGEILWKSETVPCPTVWEDEPPNATHLAVCDIRYELSDWVLDRFPEMLCLHCAAVKVGDGLVVFPGPSRAGKTSLAIQMAEQGYQIFGDDVLPLTDDLIGVSIGVQPRVRLPLPTSIPPSTRQFVEERFGTKGSKFVYLKLKAEELAGFGEKAPVKAFVLLDRVESGEARIEPASQGEMLKWTIDRNFAHKRPASAIFSAFESMTSCTALWKLTYSDNVEAIKALESVLSDTSRDSAL